MIGNIHGMNINDLDLNLLRVAHVVAEERSVTRAAERLGLSQPAVSNALARLRNITQDQIFLRGRGGMHLTSYGEEFAAHVAQAMQRIDTAFSGGSEVDPSRLTEPIIITCADEEILLYGAAIRAALDRLGCAAPVQFLPLSMDFRADVLWRTRQSLTITTMHYAPEGLKQRKLYDETLVCLMRKDHASVGAFDLETYLSADHLLIAPLGGAPSGYLDGWFRAQGRERRIRMISHSFGAAASLVKETGLIATLPKRQAERSRGDADLIIAPLPADAPPFSVHMFWSERYDKDPVTLWLRDVVAQAIAAA